jgi:hypothetical protein
MQIHQWAAASTAAILYCLSPLVWQYAVTAEVFSLNNFLVSLLLYVTLCFGSCRNQNGRLVYANLGALVCGLALTNQHTAILFEIPLILYVTWSIRDLLYLRPLLTILSIGSSFFFGLLPYAYLPIYAKYRPKPGAWGDVTNLKGFIHHLR